MSAVWVVRVSDSIKHQEYALEKGCVVIGFEDVGNLEILKTRESAFNKVRAAYPEKGPQGKSNQKISSMAYQPYDFAHAIQADDYVVMPIREALSSGRSARTSYSAIGIVQDNYSYDENAGEGCKHQREVLWLNKEFPNGGIPGNASLSSHRTVFQMRNTNADDLKSALSGTEPATSDDFVDPDDISRRRNIQGYIRKNFPGDQLSDLVKEILIVMGYECELTLPGPDGGIDIVVYHDLVESFGVQVKNTADPKGSPSLNQFSGALQNWKFSKGLFVSWSGFGGPRNEAKIKKDYSNIRLWDAEKIEHLVKKYYEKFSDEFKRDKLSLEQVWMLKEVSVDEAVEA